LGTDPVGHPDPAATHLHALAKLVHAQRGRMTNRQRAEGAHFLVARWTWSLRRGRRSLAVWTGAAAMTAALAALTLLAIQRDRTRPIACVVEGGRLGAGGVVEAETSKGAKLEFSDGTEVTLSIDAHTQVRAVDRRGARVSLTSGSAHADVAHLDGARWYFDAGPFSIHVTGTAFTVAWNPADEQLDVDMERGTVEIDGPLSDRALPLRSGQHLTVRVRERETVVRERGEPPADPRGSRGAADTPAPPAPILDAPDVLPAPPRAKANAVGNGDRHWASALARGEIESIVSDAERSGVDACLANASASDLAALADAARYGRQDDIARRALTSLRKRFPGSSVARDSAFLLGRLEEAAGNATKASSWYGLYMTESPNGTYAPEALGRNMNIVQTLYGADRARDIARDYLLRFPGGTYATRAQALAHQP
jgi:TolA-binding protein